MTKNPTIPDQYIVNGGSVGAVPNVYRHHVFLTDAYMREHFEPMFNHNIVIINAAKGHKKIKNRAVDKNKHLPIFGCVQGYLFSFQNQHDALSFKLKHSDGLY